MAALTTNKDFQQHVPQVIPPNVKGQKKKKKTKKASTEVSKGKAKNICMRLNTKGWVNIDIMKWWLLELSKAIKKHSLSDEKGCPGAGLLHSTQSSEHCEGYQKVGMDVVAHPFEADLLDTATGLLRVPASEERTALIAGAKGGSRPGYRHDIGRVATRSTQQSASISIKAQAPNGFPNVEWDWTCLCWERMSRCMCH